MWGQPPSAVGRAKLTGFSRPQEIPDLDRFSSYLFQETESMDGAAIESKPAELRSADSRGGCPHIKPCASSFLRRPLGFAQPDSRGRLSPHELIC
jgi:hypothetical protein